MTNTPPKPMRENVLPMTIGADNPPIRPKAEAMKERAASLGMPPEMLEKNELVIDGGLRSLEICKRAGVPVAYGTDLLGPLQSEQSREFVLRTEVLSPLEIIRSATSVGARQAPEKSVLVIMKGGRFYRNRLR
jgi:hypothetical protein